MEYNLDGIEKVAYTDGQDDMAEDVIEYTRTGNSSILPEDVVKALSGMVHRAVQVERICWLGALRDVAVGAIGLTADEWRITETAINDIMSCMDKALNKKEVSLG